MQWLNKGNFKDYAVKAQPFSFAHKWIPLLGEGVSLYTQHLAETKAGLGHNAQYPRINSFLPSPSIIASSIKEKGVLRGLTTAVISGAFSGLASSSLKYLTRETMGLGPYNATLLSLGVTSYLAGTTLGDSYKGAMGNFLSGGLANLDDQGNFYYHTPLNASFAADMIDFGRQGRDLPNNAWSNADWGEYHTNNKTPKMDFSSAIQSRYHSALHNQSLSNLRVVENKIINKVDSWLPSLSSNQKQRFISTGKGALLGGGLGYLLTKHNRGRAAAIGAGIGGVLGYTTHDYLKKLDTNDTYLTLRKGIANVSLGLVPLNNNQAAHLQGKGDSLNWFERPYFSSKLGSSLFNQGANYGSTVSGWLTNDILHPWADKVEIAKLNKGLIGLSPIERTQYIKTNAAKYRKAGAVSIFSGGGEGEIVVDEEAINSLNNKGNRYHFYKGNFKGKHRPLTREILLGSNSLRNTINQSKLPQMNCRIRGIPEVKFLIKELGYSDASILAEKLIQGMDPNLLPYSKSVLQVARDDYDRGKISLDELSLVELEVIGYLASHIDYRFPYESDMVELPSMLANNRANCVGYSQLYHILGKSLGLSPIVIDVSKRQYDEGLIRHAGTLYTLSNGKSVAVDGGIWGKPFLLEKEYYPVSHSPDGKANYIETLNPSNYYKKIRLHPHWLPAAMKDWEALRASERGDYREAVKLAKEAVRLDPENSTAHGNLGAFYRNLSLKAKDPLTKIIYASNAFQAYHAAIDLNPDYSEPWLYIENLLPSSNWLYKHTRISHINDPKLKQVFQEKTILFDE